MKTIVLGKTNLKVNKNGFGALPIQRVSEKEAVYLLHKAYDNGINFYDTARFYTDSEETIIANLSDIAKKLARLDGGRSTIAAMLIDDGFYEGGNAEALAKLLKLRNVYVDIDEEEIVVCFETGTDDGYMENYVHVELFGELFEISGWAE